MWTWKNNLLAQFAFCHVELKNSDRITTICILSAIKRLLAQLWLSEVFCNKKKKKNTMWVFLRAPKQLETKKQKKQTKKTPFKIKILILSTLTFYLIYSSNVINNNNCNKTIAANVCWYCKGIKSLFLNKFYFYHTISTI